MKARKARPALEMFACEDLPLWSGTPQRVDDSPFAPAARPEPAAAPLPLPGFEAAPAAPGGAQ